jgi:Lrp/AsnC family leucine-responsive transcriptional regulator
MKTTAMKLDEIDKKILTILQHNCKISNSALAQEINLTAPAALERVKKLEKNGLILGYRAVLNKKELGKGLTCFISLHLEHHNRQEIFPLIEEGLKSLEEIEEIHLLTGRHDYLIKINIRDVDELRTFLMEKLTKIGYINEIETFLAISSISNTNANLINENE